MAARVARLQCNQIVGDLSGEFRAANDVVELRLGLQQPLRIVHLDNGRALLAHGVERRLDHPIHFLVLAHEVACDTDACAFQCIRLQVTRVVGLELARTFLCRGIRGIDSRHHTQGRRHVGDVQRQRSAGIEGEGQRHDAASAQQSMGGLQADDAVRCGRSTNRTAGVGAHPQGCEHRGDAGAGAAGRARGGAGEVMGIQGLAADGAMSAARGELRQVDLGENDGAGVAQFFYQKSILRRDRAPQHEGARGGRQIRGVVVVFQYHRNAVQRTARSFRSALGIERTRRVERRGIQCDDGVDRRPLLVVGLDARQVELGELFRGQASLRHGVFEICDAGLGQVDRRGLDRGGEQSRRCAQHQRGQKTGTAKTRHVHGSLFR